jgi:hypothetical protein
MQHELAHRSVVRQVRSQMWSLRLGEFGDLCKDDAVPEDPEERTEWWTTSDVAEYLGVKVGTVSSYRLRGQMPPPDMTVGRTHMWKPERIRQWHEGRPRPGVGGRPVDGASSRAG